MMPFLKVPDTDADDVQRSKRLEARIGAHSRSSVLIFLGGCAAIVIFAALALVGLPGSGLILVPIGLGMMLGGGIELVLGRLGA